MRIDIELRYSNHRFGVMFHLTLRVHPFNSLLSLDLLVLLHCVVLVRGHGMGSVVREFDTAAISQHQYYSKYIETLINWVDLRYALDQLRLVDNLTTLGLAVLLCSIDVGQLPL